MRPAEKHTSRVAAHPPRSSAPSPPAPAFFEMLRFKLFFSLFPTEDQQKHHIQNIVCYMLYAPSTRCLQDNLKLMWFN